MSIQGKNKISMIRLLARVGHLTTFDCDRSRGHAKSAFWPSVEIRVLNAPFPNYT